MSRRLSSRRADRQSRPGCLQMILTAALVVAILYWVMVVVPRG